MSEQTVSEQSVIPPGTEFTVYWCPRCETSGAWHTCERPNPLIPQMDIETRCLTTKFVMGTALRATGLDRCGS